MNLTQALKPDITRQWQRHFQINSDPIALPPSSGLRFQVSGLNPQLPCKSVLSVVPK